MSSGMSLPDNEARRSLGAAVRVQPKVRVVVKVTQLPVLSATYGLSGRDLRSVDRLSPVEGH